MPDWAGLALRVAAAAARSLLADAAPAGCQQPRRGRGDFGDGDADYAAGKAITGEELRRSYGPE